MSITITGTRGYIGSHLTKIIQADQEIDLKIGSDINDPKLKIDTDVLIHLAAYVRVGESVDEPLRYYHNNINGTVNLLKNFNGKHFIFASTGAAAGDLTSPYAISKKVAEDIVIEQCQKRGIDYTIFRFYNVIGNAYGIKPTNPDGLFYALTSAETRGYINVYGKDYDTPDGTCIRDYVHVMEICKSIQRAIDSPSNSIESLGHGTGHSVLDIIEWFKEVNDQEFDVRFQPRRAGDLPETVLPTVSKFMQFDYDILDMLKIS